MFIKVNPVLFKEAESAVEGSLSDSIIILVQTALGQYREVESLFKLILRTLILCFIAQNLMRDRHAHTMSAGSCADKFAALL